MLPAVVATKVYLVWTNSLVNNGRWTSTKASLAKAPMCSVSFTEKPQAVAWEHLDLGAWFGFQEVIYKDPVDLRALAFDAWLAEATYVTFEFGRDNEITRGLRLSVNAAYPNAYLRIAPDGEFVEKITMSDCGLRARVWNHIELRRQESGLALKVNGAPVDLPAGIEPGINALGFRGCHRSVLIDNVIGTPLHGWRRIVERFANHRHGPLAFVAALAAVLASGGVLAAIQYRLRVTARHIAFSVITQNGVLSVIAGCAWLYFAFVQTIYPSFNIDQSVMAERARAAADTNAAITTRLAQYVARAGTEPFEIMFLGTSQTWGEGITNSEDTFVERIECELNARAGQDRYLCLNASAAGAYAFTLRLLYQGAWVNLKPDLVVVILSSNDWNGTEFAQSLSGIVDLNQRNGIKTLFVLEANSIEARPGELDMHPIMRQVAAAKNVPLANLHECLKSPYDSGFLWWDLVHLSSYGHRLAAECLLDAMTQAHLLPQ